MAKHPIIKNPSKVGVKRYFQMPVSNLLYVAPAGRHFEVIYGFTPPEAAFDSLQPW